MRKLLSTTFLLGILAGCAGGPLSGSVHQMRVVFDPGEAKQLLQPGRNTIKGNAFLRQTGGGVVTCAGATVYLVPATAYAKERIAVLYGSSNFAGYDLRTRFNPDSPEYVSLVHTTRCDSQGNFVFERVADGEFFIRTVVTWRVGYDDQGGSLIHRVSVDGGQTVNAIMAR